MIFSGAMAEAANAMRSVQRGINRRVATSLRRARARGARVYDGDYEPIRADFPCMFLCGTCGYFVDELNSGEPSDSQGCPACAEGDWIDLGVEELADRVRDMEALDRMDVPKHIRLLVRITLPVLVVIAITGLFIAANLVSDGDDYATYGCILLGAAILILPVAHSLLPRVVSLFLVRFQKRPPYRWHVPLSLPDPKHAASRRMEDLQAQTVDETLTAPISGRECLAYQVSVLFDTPGDARPPEWVLQEQRAVKVGLGDELQVAPASLYLESPVEQVDAPGDQGVALKFDKAPPEKDEQYPKLKKFLRQRGLFITDGEFRFYEARLEPGDLVGVADYDGEVYVIRHASAPKAGKLPRLPKR